MSERTHIPSGAIAIYKTLGPNPPKNWQTLFCMNYKCSEHPNEKRAFGLLAQWSEKGFLKHISCSPLNTVRVSKHRAKHFYLTFIWKISFAKNGKLCDDKLENNFSKINKSRLQQVYFFWCASTRGTYISRLSDGKGWQDKIRDVSRTAKQPKAHLWPWDAGGPSIPIIVSPLSHLSHKKTSYQTLRAK